jgi:outer membrane lipopolysaccharide assembly protein LptE/RlpB
LPGIIRALTGLVLALAVLGLGGCSALRLSYNNAAELMHWWIDGFADFDKAQSQQVRSDLAAFARWHRQEELPQIAELLQSAEALANQPQPTAGQVCAMYARGLQRMEAMVERALPTAAAVVPTLQASQIKHMAATYDKNNRKWRDDWLGSDKDGVPKRIQKFRERLEDFYGPITPAQLRQLQASMDKVGSDEPLQYREVLRRQQEVLQTLAKLRQADTSTAQAALAALAKSYFSSPDANYRAYRDQGVAQTCEAIAEFHRSATEKQRKSMAAALQGYLGDVRALMAQTP